MLDEALAMPSQHHRGKLSPLPDGGAAHGQGPYEYQGPSAQLGPSDYQGSCQLSGAL